MSKLVKDSDNSLNICSMGALFSLWHLSTSPAYYIMQEMHNYSSFNAFLAEAADSDIHDFIPEIALKDKDESSSDDSNSNNKED